MAQFLFKRSGTADKRPDPAQMALGEVDLNYNAVSGGLFYKDSGGGVIKVGPAQVSVDPPNATPAGSAGNSPGEFWYSTSDGFLYVWDGSTWNTTAPGIGLASPTVPGVVYGLTADTELNVALGKGAGSNITTGTCNVALGPNVAVASATGNCQLALGYSATANWLTGDSTKAIKPGAGIIDCANSCGTASQLLSSTGSNALEWITPNYITPTALNASSAGSLIVNGCDYGGSVCVTSILPGPGAPGQILTNAYDSGNPGYLAGQGYLNWCTPDFISQSSFGPGALVVGCTPGSTGGICTVGSVINANNPGVAVGYYQGVTVTTCTGSGSGALATVNVINGGYFPILDSVEITQPGTGYALSNQVGFTICGTTVTTTAFVCSLNQTTICKAGYLSVGTNGQVLTADSTCALGVKWAATSGGSGIPCACITGQGALITGTAASTPVALAVGTADQVLTVDLACASGLKWATPSTASAATPTAAGIVLGSTGASNTAIGCNALNVTLTGTDNVAAGLCALFAVTDGLGNAAVGNFAAAGTTTGCYNVAMGLSALRTNSSGTRNVAIGENAGRGNTTGCFNVAVGSAALCGTSTGTDNTAVGYQALLSNTISVGNTAVGSLALSLNTASCNTAVGLNALRTNSTGIRNTAVGAQALCANDTGNDNTSLGFCAGIAVTGNSNTLIGSLSGRQMAGANSNVAVGRNSLCSASTGSFNTAVGAEAMISMGLGQLNTALGASVMGSATGSNNVGIGALAGCNLTTGSSNVAIGCGVTLASATANCQLAIGFASGCNWLTGDNTKAIRPGAGIIDCANSCGANGQVLMSNGANALCWGTVSGGASTATPSVSGTVFGCADTANAAIGSGVFATRTTGGCNSALGLAAFPALTTGCYNIALGDSGGSTITTGCYNITLGSGVTVPNATGSCQLAIGAQSGALWLTGDSTLAIKPGAGIIDCNGSCGSAGQALLSDGANAVVWGSGGLSADLLSEYNTVSGCGQFGGNLIVGCYIDGANFPRTLYPGLEGSILCYDFYLNGVSWCVPNYVRGNCFTKGSIPVGCAQVGGGIGTVGISLGNNPGVPVGYYTDIPIAGGSGTGATANLNVINVGYFPLLDSVEIVDPGSGYLVGDNNMTVTVNGTLLSSRLSVTALAPNTINNYTFLSVGTNDQVLTADSACTNGVKWAAAAAAAATPTVAGAVLAKTQSSGTNSTALGSGALGFAGVGGCNVGVGLNAGCGLNGGACNTIVGSLAGDALTSGCNNTAIGFCALSLASTTCNSVAIGSLAICRGTAEGATAVGTCALKNLTSGVCNTAVGFAALSAITTGQCNTAVGYRALTSTVTGARNVAIGEDSLPNVTGSDNVAIGNSTGQNNFCTFGNTYIGSCTAVTDNGCYNTVIGFQALCDFNGTTGSNNIVIGCCAATATGGVSGILVNASNRIVMGNSAHTCAQIQVAWSATSDVRDKALDPAGVPYGLLFVEQLEPIAYRFCNRETNEVTDEKLRYGFSAQGVRGLEGDIPVISNDDNPDKLNITDSYLLPVLVNAIKELSDKNKLLEERIAALEDK